MKSEERKALEVITAWRQLKSKGLLTPEEVTTIAEKITAKYGEFLSPLRETPDVSIKGETKRCVIARYDKTIKEPPYLTIPLDKVEVLEPEDDEGGVELAKRLIAACNSKGYTFKFYTSSSKENVDYELVVH